ncbi:MAG: hypothetical protein IJE58_03180 [Oscillospiraceae bacterium]|nr:hypothetical protein [Oscillospiraceae bacterium]
MKKIVALSLCLIMVLGLLSGCEKAMDAKTLLQKMEEAGKNQTAMSGKMSMEMDMSMGITGITMTIGMDMNMDMAVDVEAGKLFADMDVTMELLGQTEEESMQLYGVRENDEMVMYAYEDTAETWIKTTQTQNLTEQYEQMLVLQLDPADVPEECLSLAKAKEIVDGKTCYVLTMDMDGTYFNEMMKAAMQMSMGEMGEMDEESMAMLENADLSALNMTMVYYVDTKTFIPVQMTGEILGMGDVLNSMMAPMLAEAGGLMGDADVEVKIDVPVCKITLTDVVYGDVEVPDVPQEAIDNAIDADSLEYFEIPDDELLVDDSMLTNPAQPDGSYLLSAGSGTIRVVLPEGYTPVESEADFLTSTDATYTSFLGYGLVADMTLDEFKSSFQEEIDWAKEYEYYKSHTDVTDLDGYQYMSLIYNDNTSVWFLWKELDDCIFVMSAEVEGETCDLTALLSAVEFVAE